jgi:hypothetical protein
MINRVTAMFGLMDCESPRSRYAELMVLCARIGFNP